MMMTLLFLREDAGHFSKGSEGDLSELVRRASEQEGGKTKREGRRRKKRKR